MMGLLPKPVKVLQFDLNVNRPESQQLPERYAADSINMANLRVFIHENDKEKFLQLVKDAKLQLALWTYFPADKVGEVNNVRRTLIYPPYPSLRERLRGFFRR